MTFYHTPTLTGGEGKNESFKLISEAVLKWRLVTQTSWLLGDIRWPITVSALDSKTCDPIRVREEDGSLYNNNNNI